MKVKNKTVFKIAFISICLFIVIAAYFWYLYFDNYEGKVLSKSIRLELVNSGNIEYVNASPDDPSNIIPTYYFRVKNNLDSSINYEITLDDISPSEVKDGCSEGTLFARDELRYILKRENMVIKTGHLSDLKNNVLDSATLSGHGIYDYSIKVSLDDKAGDNLARHYHFQVNLKEK